MFAADRRYFLVQRCRRSAALLFLGSLALPALGADPEPQYLISGGGEELRENVRAHINLSGEPCSASLLRLRRQLPSLRRSVTQALNALGYYHATFTTEFRAGDQCWELAVGIEPGEPVRLREVDMKIVGGEAEQELFGELLEDSGLEPGVPLNHGNYEQLKDRLGSRASDLGYFDARFSASQIALHLPTKAADVRLWFEPGERYRFGELRVTREGILSDELIDDLLSVKTGDPYAADRLVTLRSALERSQYFSSIGISPRLKEAQGKTVPVDIDLKLRPRHAWTGGIGFTTDTGPRARVMYENRFINKRGHRFSADSSISAVRGQVNGSYTIPLQHPWAESVVTSAAYIVEHNDAFDSNRVQTALTLPSENRWGWQQSLSLEVQHDDYEFASSENSALLVMPGVTLSKTRADDLINPSRGWKLHGSLKGGSETLLSDTSFLQFYGNAKLVQQFGIMRVLARAELGATWIDEELELPVSQRFYAGGDQSVRGYDFRALGPMDENGEIIGGKQLAVGSLEVDFRIAQNWRVALFTDAGNAFRAFDSFDVKQSVGLGLRWLSPIGPLRFDVAHPIDGEESFRIHVTMGPDL